MIDPAADAAVTLNGAGLPAVATGVAYRGNVTAMLRDRNLLVLVPRQAVETGLPPQARGPLSAAFGSVRLEIVSGDASDGGPIA